MAGANHGNIAGAFGKAGSFLNPWAGAVAFSGKKLFGLGAGAADCSTLYSKSFKDGSVSRGGRRRRRGLVNDAIEYCSNIS